MPVFTVASGEGPSLMLEAGVIDGRDFKLQFVCWSAAGASITCKLLIDELQSLINFITDRV